MVAMMQSSKIGTTQIIAYDATTPITNAFGPQTYQIKIVANSGCHYHIYSSTESATATTSDPLLPPLWIEYITVTPGQKISAIKAVTQGSITASAGILSVTELS